MSRQQPEDRAVELALALRLLVRRLRSMAPAEAPELTWAQKAVMIRLDTDGPATAAELARAEGVKPQSMGATIGALEGMGIVERRAHPTDGRQMNVALTAKGARVRKDSRIASRTWLAQAIEKLDANEKRHLSAATALMKRLGEL